MADDIRRAICDRVNSLLVGGRRIKVLEAGCGSASHVTFMADVYAVGIDISKEQLEKNAVVQEKIIGDIQECPLPKEEFDAVVCWMVLEHLSRPKDALLNLFGSIKPRGLLILAIPNLLSFKGVVTKMTPFWFHELFYRFMRYKSHPFPTYLRVAIVPKRLTRFAEENGFSVVFCRLLEGDVAKRLRSRFWIVETVFSVLNSFTRVISLGKSQSLLLDNCFMILRKGGEIS